MEKKNPRILVACGGTSGHINPALAIAEEIRRRRPGTEFLFVGTKNHLEAELVPRAGFPIRFISAVCSVRLTANLLRPTGNRHITDIKQNKRQTNSRLKLTGGKPLPVFPVK